MIPHGYEVINYSSAFDQTKPCISSVLCYSAAPCAISQLYTVCLSLKRVFEALELCYIYDDMQSCPSIHHQAFFFLTSHPGWISVSVLLSLSTYLSACLLRNFLSGVPSLFPSAGCVPLHCAFTLTTPLLVLTCLERIMSTHSVPRSLVIAVAGLELRCVSRGRT